MLLLLLLWSHLVVTAKGFQLISPSNRFQPIFDGPSLFSSPQISRLPLHASLDDRQTGLDISGDVLTLRRVTDERIDDFVFSIEDALQKKTFVTLTLWGPTKTKKGRNKKKQVDSDNDSLRGCIRQIHFRRVLIKQKEFLQATFKYHGATDIAKNWPLGNLTESNLKNVRRSIQYLLEPESYEPMDEFVPVSEWGNSSDNNLPTIQKGRLGTLDKGLELDINPRTKSTSLKRTELNTPLDTDSAVNQHDRVKQVPLDTNADFLKALGLTTKQGKPKQAMASKLRQCQKFVEIVANLVERVSFMHPNINNPSEICVHDLGCGRGYLTFSLHAYLQQVYETVKSIGVDLRPKLVNEINDVATSLGPSFSTLHFKEGSIEDMLPSSNVNDSTSQPEALDILIALHACDTATDDALWCGISRKAHIIVVAPCCHKEVRPQLNAHMSRKDVSSNHPLADILQHNVYRERHSEMVTDSIRGLLLELAGYQVQVFEFVGGEHTAKNVMITAIRNTSPSDQNLSPAKKMDLRKRIHELSSLHGIERQKLAQWMGDAFLGEGSVLVERSASKTSKKSRISSVGMPPL